MCKLLDNCLGSLLNRAGIIKFGAVAFIALAATALRAAPANDNFTNATVITGIIGTTNGTTIGATKEAGEPNHAGNTGGESIWYKWTSPTNGTIVFNTEGSTFDTLLEVYTGSSVSNLTPIAANDDVNFPVDVTSQVSFTATNGGVYYIAVDGYNQDFGSVKLNWAPTVGSGSAASQFAGQFQFASSLSANGAPLYVFTEHETTPEVYEVHMTLNGARARITRTLGSAGLVHVHYTVTNTVYTNIFITNIFGTNILATVTFPPPGPGGPLFTNIYLTNISVTRLFANNQNGIYSGAGLTYCTNLEGTTIIRTNDNSGFDFTFTTNYSVPLSPPLLCRNTNSTGFVTNSGTTTNIIQYTTNVFCTNIIVTNYTPSATPFVDYVPKTGTVDFKDYQMGADIPINIKQNGANLFNRVIVVSIDSVTIDASESTAISPPIIAPVGSNAIVNVLSLQATGLRSNLCDPTNLLLNLDSAVYTCTESVGGLHSATVFVVRGGTDFNASGSAQYDIDFLVPTSQADHYHTFPLQPGSDYATPDNPVAFPTSSQPADFTSVTGTVSIGARQAFTEINIPIVDDNLVEFNEDMFIRLHDASGGLLGQSTTATLTILFDDQPAGAVDRDFNPNDDANTDPPFNSEPGANKSTFACVLQPDGKILIGGDFTAYNTKPRNSVARVNIDGSIDAGFLAPPNSGANGTVTSIALGTNANIFIGGSFTAFNGTNRNSIARLTADGSLDGTFNPGVGVNGTVWAMALQPDGRIIIAGDFSTVNATNRNNIARLNPDGSLDTTFNPLGGPNATVNAVALQPDGRVVIGGEFTLVNGTPRQEIARLNSDGTLDTSFDPGTGADANTAIYALAIQSDGRILAGGTFNTINLTSRKSIVRLNSDGSLDLSFNPGDGANDAVYSIQLQTDSTILIGGLFTSYNQTRRIGVARLLSTGALDTSFMDTAYNQFAGLVNTYYSSDVEPKNFVYCMAIQGDGNILIAGGFNHIGGGFGTNALGVSIPVRDGFVGRQNFTRLIGGSTPGPGNIGLVSTNYSADENGGNAYVTIARSNGHLGPAGVTVSAIDPPVGPGAAVSGTDYTFDPSYANPVFVSTWPTVTWMQSDAISGPNNHTIADVPNTVVVSLLDDVYVKIIDNNILDGNRSFDLALSNPTSSDVFFLGGENIPLGVALDTQTAATMDIIDNESAHGTLSFSSPTYTVNEGATNAVITVTRTGGSAGQVTVLALTVAGGTAVPGTTNDYLTVSNRLTFNATVTNQTFTIPIVDNSVSQPDRTVFLLLTNITGGGAAGLTNATLTIIDNDFLPGRLNFTSTNFGANETDGTAIITVSRTGGSSGAISISCASSNGTATNGLNYTAATNILSWGAGDTSLKTFLVPLFHDGLVTSNLTVNLSIFNPVINGATNYTALGLRTNAVLTITNNDSFGQPTLSAASYNVNENAGFITITVNRLGGAAQSISVNYATTNGSAFQNVNYSPTSGTLTFAPGEFSKSFIVPIIDDIPPAQNGNQTFTVTLSSPTPSSGPGGGVTLGSPSSATVTIIDNETYNQPAGGLDTTYNPNAFFNDTVYSLALQTNGELLAAGDFTVANSVTRNRIARLNSDGTLDLKFSSQTDGTDNSIRTLAFQTDGRILIGGLFTKVNGVNRSAIARLNYDGSLDTGFNPGGGADNPVYAVAETFIGSVTNHLNRRVIVCGSFSSIGGITSPDIAQFNDDGSVDSHFSSAGANGAIYAVAVYSTNDVNSGKILIGGDFTQVGGIARRHIARLNADGSIDASFNPGAGANDSVRAIAIQVDGKIVIGGLFTMVGNTALNHIARLTPSGLADSAFNPGVGANDVVSCLALQEDHKIVVGGSFTRASGVTRNRLTRLNEDGSLDPAINFGLGADNFVAAVVVQSDDRIIIGGGFTQFNGLSRPHIARIYGLTTPGPGTLTFTAANYSVNESGTNIVITVRRDGGTSDFNIGNVYVDFATSDGSAIAGADYVGVTNTLTFPVGETFETVTIPIINNSVVDNNRTVNLTLSNPTDAALGAQPTATLTIINNNSDVNLSSPTYRVAKDVSSGEAVITVLRNGSSLGAASVNFATTFSGTANPGIDYVPVSNTVFFADGDVQQNVNIPIINNGVALGDRTVGIALSNPTNTIIASPGTAILTIVDDSISAGNIMFSATNYSVSELSNTVTVNVIRTNGLIGQISVGCIAGGGTAVPGLDYVPTNVTLTFADGETNKSFQVAVLHNPLVTGNQTVNLTLTNPTGGAQIIPPSMVPLTIVDVDVGLAFDLPAYFVDEKTPSVTIGVRRLSGTNGSVSVQYATTNGTAFAGTNYVATSGTLTFAAGETFKTFNVTILNNPQITGNEIFYVQLSSPSSPGQLVNPTTTAVTVLDDNIGLSLVTATNSVSEAGSNILVSVVRSGSAVGAVSVNFATSDGTATNGVRYFATNGVLAFADGQVSNFFQVGIINDNLVEGDQTFNVTLSNPTAGAQLLTPSNEVITVIDDDSAITFSSAGYSVAENGVTALITAVRTGVTNTTVSVNFSTSNLTAVAGVQYTATNGLLIFTNGQTSATFGVGIIDANVTGGSETVDLRLSNPSTNSTLASPSEAVLTIFNNDGSLIVPAGSYLLAETGAGAPNNVIDPGETVTLLLALRNSAGSNTTANFKATLLASNGVSSPSPGTAVTYGVLVTNGASVSRQFQFTASGTNGSKVNATLQMQDGTNNLGFAIFPFTLGQTVSSYTNSALITINDHAAATPYPSAITVSSLSGVINKVTASVLNLGHAYVSDVCMLLVGPGGQKDLLMAQAGGGHTITNVTLTFDDTAAAYLTTNAPVNGTNKPTAFSTGIPFPAPAPAGIYNTNFSNLLGISPNGTWSLYVYDNKNVDTGTINNGWSLSISSLNVLSPAIDLIVKMSASSNPSVVGSNLTYTITITNSGPAPASGVFLTNILPPGVTVVSSNSSQGSWSAGASNTFICNLGGLAKDGTASATLVVVPPTIGTITNTIIAGANEADAYLADNTASVVTTISGPTADLGMGATDAPDPIFVGNTLTYSVSVTNFGPATATNVIVTNTLSGGVTLSSIVPPGGTASTNSGIITITYSLGSLGSGSTTGFVINVVPKVAGIVTNNYSVGSGVADPLKGNNSGSAKTEVDFVQLGVGHSGNNLTFSWPTTASGYQLQSSPSLNPASWTNVPNAPGISGGNYVVTIPLSGGPKFFRLIGPAP